MFLFWFAIQLQFGILTFCSVWWTNGCMDFCGWKMTIIVTDDERGREKNCLIMTPSPQKDCWKLKCVFFPRGGNFRNILGSMSYLVSSLLSVSASFGSLPKRLSKIAAIFWKHSNENLVKMFYFYFWQVTPTERSILTKWPSTQSFCYWLPKNAVFTTYQQWRIGSDMYKINGEKGNATQES